MKVNIWNFKHLNRGRVTQTNEIVTIQYVRKYSICKKKDRKSLNFFKAGFLLTTTCYLVAYSDDLSRHESLKYSYSIKKIRSWYFFKLYNNISFKKHSLIPKSFPVMFDLVRFWLCLLYNNKRSTSEKDVIPVSTSFYASVNWKPPALICGLYIILHQ